MIGFIGTAITQALVCINPASVEKIKMSEWISVKDRLPEDCDFVLVAAIGKGTGEPRALSIGRYNDGVGVWWLLKNFPNNAWVCGDILWDMNDTDITHWMELPEGPPNAL